MRLWTGSIWLRIGTVVAGTCECCNEHGGSQNAGNFLTG